MDRETIEAALSRLEETPPAHIRAGRRNKVAAAQGVVPLASVVFRVEQGRATVELWPREITKYWHIGVAPLPEQYRERLMAILSRIP